MRLPSYRSSHMRRYHPYPRYALSQHERLMQTEEDESQNGYERIVDVLEVNRTLWTGLRAHDEETLNLEEALRILDDVDQLPRRRRSLSTLIIDLALFVMRKIVRKRPKLAAVAA
ncbi:hypothetical protein BJ138DRAFT_223674 [Hygrophoropsis aurantiaca]|uniref:Uncharacterized protein n=1 Tax=Hygrophoropsis aurantiaca TaxID=72124 RepID=A0ACB8AQ68_9AGAM|nr:hypothetical protein BJ138DRAFT_223674 [Hygrophoropsis aurantiaca]